MLHGADSGKTWATIVEKLPSGKNEFIANCPIMEEADVFRNTSPAFPLIAELSATLIIPLSGCKRKVMLFAVVGLQYILDRRRKR